MRFVLIDETLVSYGFWAIVNGIELKQFEKNPLMYWMHQRPSSWDGKEQMLPIGNWKDVKVEKINGINSITAEPVFDENDKFALKIKKKVEGNFIRMASAGLSSITWSDEKKYLKPGQTRSTLVKSEMLEASIVDMGANRNAVRLYDETGIINLTKDNIKNYIPKINLKTNYNMKSTALKLGLSENATEAEILAEIEKLQNSEKKNQEAVSKMQAEKIEKLMQNENINDENREHFQKLAETNFGLAETTLEIMSIKEKKEQPKQERLSDYIKNQKPDASKTEKSWKDYSDEELINLRENNSELYEKIYKTEFNMNPIID